jgi:hypothetical protein
MKKRAVVLLLFVILPFILNAGTVHKKGFLDWVKILLGGPKVASMELISRDAPAFTNDDCGGKSPAAKANNSDYSDEWRACGKPSVKKPVWLAYDLSKVPEGKRADVLLVWYNEDTSPYEHSLITAINNPGYNNPGYNNPRDFTVELNTAPGGVVPEKGWLRYISVGNNGEHSGQCSLKMKGCNWVRFMATSSDGTKDNEGIALNMDIYDASNGTEDDWIFIGDSITQMSMNHGSLDSKAGKGTFTELVNRHNKKYFPVQENGGTGYMTSADGAKNIERWVWSFPGKYVGLSYGTNDAWTGMDPKDFYTCYEKMVKTVLAAGKVPVIPRSIPWSTTQGQIQKNGALLDREVQKLFRKYPAIIKGPDFREYFKNNPKLISQDGEHPSWPEGLFMYRKLWADAAIKEVYGW